MPVAVDEVRRVAALAGLALSDSETGRLASELSKIVDYAEMLSEVLATERDEVRGPVVGESPLRPDAVGDTLTPADALANAPESEGDFFRVPGFLPGD